MNDLGGRDPVDRTHAPGVRELGGIVRCDACPVLCRIRPGREGACGRYANACGRLVRTDPMVLAQKVVEDGGALVEFATNEGDGTLIRGAPTFVTGIGAGTTYPDYKPAPFIVANAYDGCDTVTVVSEGMFTYCGVKVKIDTDRHLGAERSSVRYGGRSVGHVTTAEYGSQMLALGGVRQLTAGDRETGVATCELLERLCNREPVGLTIDDGAEIVVEAGAAPIVDGRREERMRGGCGSAIVGMFARQWAGEVDEVVVVDDHVTGVLSEHQAGRALGLAPSGVRLRGRRSTPGRYFQVAGAGRRWGGTDLGDPRAVVDRIDARHARPGLRVLITSTTGEDAFFAVLDDDLELVETAMPATVAATVARIREHCEPALCTVMFTAGAGGSLRAGVTENPVLLTRSVRAGETRVTMGGAPAYVWPGGGITVMVDVARMPAGAFGSIPTPALVAPIEFTLPRHLYAALGGHDRFVRPLEDVLEQCALSARIERWLLENPWPLARRPS